MSASVGAYFDIDIDIDIDILLCSMNPYSKYNK